MITRAELRKLVYLAGVELAKYIPPRSASDYQIDLMRALYEEGTRCEETALYESLIVHPEPDGTQ